MVKNKNKNQMKKHILFIVLIVTQFVCAQQQENIFLSRKYWDTRPTVEQIKEKIKQGNNPVEFNSYRFDATCYAILQNSPIETIDFLTSIPGNEITKITHDGRNYLLWAAYKGNLEAMKLFVNKGSDVNLVDEHGYNLITFAAFGNKFTPSIFYYIKKIGIDIESTNRQGANILLIAASNAKSINDILYLTKEGFSLEAEDKLGNNAFYYAAASGNIEFLKELVAENVAYKKINDLNENALFSAARGKRRFSNTVKVFTYLLQKGLEPTLINKDGATVLHQLATNNPNKEIYTIFIDKGVNINAKDNQGNTAFLIAAKRDNTSIAKWLAGKYNTIKDVNRKGQSALTFSVINYNQELFDFMINNDANLQIKDALGNNLLYYLFENYNEYKSDFFTKNIKLLENNVKLESGAKKKNTLLHIAVKKNNFYLVEKAINLGVAVNQLNKEGLSALHLAAMKAKDLKIIKFLLKKGADKYQKTEFNETIFDLASENELLKGEKLNFLK